VLCVTFEEIGERDNLLVVGCVLMYPTKPENKDFNSKKKFEAEYYKIDNIKQDLRKIHC
jgi:hypothetical protein